MAKKTVEPPGDINCVITVTGNKAVISGAYNLEAVKEATSFYVEGHRFVAAFKRGFWDGKKHLFDKVLKSFPPGLLAGVVAQLRGVSPNAIVKVLDQREPPMVAGHGFELDGIEFGVGKYDYQLRAAEALIENKRGILKVGTGGGKTEIAAAVIKCLAVPTIFLVASLDLLHQTRKRFAKRLKISANEIGVIGDGHFTVGSWITIATPASLLPRLETPEVLAARSKWQMVINDECHSSAAEENYDVLDSLDCYYRFGLSGTPLNRSDGADLKLIAQTGEIVYEVRTKLLIERGVVVQPYVELVKIDEPKLPKSMTYQEAYTLGVAESMVLNSKVVDKILQHTELGRQVLVTVERKHHGELITALLRTRTLKVPHQFLTGDEDTTQREHALQLFVDKRIMCLIATRIFDTGIDVPCIDVLILAHGGKAQIRTLQRVGRGLRLNHGKDKLIIVDFANYCHKDLTSHSLARIKTYRNEECFIFTVEK